MRDARAAPLARAEHRSAVAGLWFICAATTTGDGAGVTAEGAASLTAREETEILLLDLGLPSAEASPE